MSPIDQTTFFQSDFDLRSFFRDGATGAMTELIYPSATETYGYDVDNTGTVVGYYLDDSGKFGGFRAVLEN